MINVRQLLQKKGHDVWSISPGSTCYDALKFMAEKNVGALLVIEREKLVGMFSERDYARKVILRGKSSKTTLVHELMTDRVYCIAPDKTVDDCMQLMTAKHVRHLPVLEEERVIGVVSIGDVVKEIISDHVSTIRDLENYITGRLG